MIELVFGIFIGSAIGLIVASMVFAGSRADLEREYLQEMYRLSKDKKSGKK